MVYYSQILGKPIIDDVGNKVGIVKDLCIKDGVRYASVCGVVGNFNGNSKMIKWESIAELGNKPNDKFSLGIYLNKEFSKIKLHDATALNLNRLLDKQIIDVKGARVVRVNDILLGQIHNKFVLIGVDISTKGIFRRLGISGLFKKLKEHIIMWKDISPLAENMSSLSIKVQREKLNQMHPAEIADLIRDLSIEEKEMIFNTLSDKKAAETLLKSQPDVQKTFFRTMSLKKIAGLLEQLPSDDSAALLSMMPSIINKKVLKQMKQGIAARIQKVMSYNKATAGAIMSTNFITIPENLKINEASELLKDELKIHRQMYYIYVVGDGGILKGAISLRQLLINDPDDTVEAHMRKDMIIVNVNAEIDDILNLMGKYSLIALPITDKERKIVGVIRVNDVLEVMLPERIKQRRIPRIQKRIKGQNGNPAK